MAVGLEQLALELLGLPAKSRAKLAEQLISSLEEDEIPDVEDAAVATAERRAKELAEGKVPGIPAEEVMRRARERLK
ncbi:MAG: addiction module protein [Thermoguttaceae bacterium]|jgi:putative addiction module component (TIGR02574 family)